MMNVGGVDVVKSIVDLEVKVCVLERVLETLVNTNPSVQVSQSAYDNAIVEAREIVKNKYPDLGLSWG